MSKTQMLETHTDNVKVYEVCLTVAEQNFRFVLGCVLRRGDTEREMRDRWEGDRRNETPPRKLIYIQDEKKRNDG